MVRANLVGSCMLLVEDATMQRRVCGRWSIARWGFGVDSNVSVVGVNLASNVWICMYGQVQTCDLC
jgi:hypothetical protein